MWAHLADFVQQQCSLVGLLELADLVANGAGESTTFVAEQFGFQQFVRQRCAVHFHERPFGSVRLFVDETCNDFLAHARFAEDQDRDIRSGHVP